MLQHIIFILSSHHLVLSILTCSLNVRSAPVPIKDYELCARRDPCFELSVPMNTTVLEAYNCDRQKPGQKSHTMPAEKQFYRADYVRQHFIHYSTITETTMMDMNEYKKNFGNRMAFPDPKSRFGDEVKEGLMLHRLVAPIGREDFSVIFLNVPFSCCPVSSF